jgi:hypothetical protein
MKKEELLLIEQICGEIAIDFNKWIQSSGFKFYEGFYIKIYPIQNEIESYNVTQLYLMYKKEQKFPLSFTIRKKLNST